MPDRPQPHPAGSSVECEPHVTLDLRGLKCPLPVLHTRRALARAEAGALLEVRCTDPLAALDIPNLVRETGDLLLSGLLRGGESRFRIRKADTRREGSGPATEDPSGVGGR